LSVGCCVFPVHRAAQAHGLSDEEVKTLVNQCIKGRLFGFPGEPRATVLELNLALDGLQ
jgi:K+-transporting ATPase ATPase C chain